MIKIVLSGIIISLTILYFTDVIFEYSLKKFFKKYYKKIILIILLFSIVKSIELIYFANNQNIKCIEEEKNNKFWFYQYYENRKICTINYQLYFKNITNVLKYHLIGWSVKTSTGEEIYYMVLLPYSKRGYSVPEKIMMYVKDEKTLRNVEKLKEKEQIFISNLLEIKLIKYEKNKKILKLLNKLKDEKMYSKVML